MTERTSSGACKKFSANVFDKNKCQNCFKPKEIHQEVSSPVASSPTRPTTLDVTGPRQRTTVKSGNLCLGTQISTLPKVRVQKWEKVWVGLYSSGDLEWFGNETGKSGQAPSGSISLDDCIGLTSAEVDTNEAFSIGIKTPLKVHYFKADNRLEMDNWCRVLKPFVIASPGYNFKSKPSATRSFSHQELKTNSPSNSSSGKSNVSRTVSAPWQTASDCNSNQEPGTKSISKTPGKKRWSMTEMEMVKEETTDEGQKRLAEKPLETDPKHLSEKGKKSSPTTPEKSPQPYYGEKYLKPVTPNGDKVNNEEVDKRKQLEIELTEARRLAKHSEGKADICSKNLADTKKSLQKANNMISIQKANIESLNSEVETLRAQVKKNNENMEKRLKDKYEGFLFSGDSVVAGSIESGFTKLHARLKENEEALIRRTRELEKANESRAKVATHTRSLLLELETKLNENNRRIAELEEQLMNRTLDLQYEKEERKRIENEKGKLIQNLTTSKEHSKKQEITKKSTELLQQARQDHLQLKSSQKSQLKHQEEIDHFRSELQKKNSEIETLRGKLADVEKNDEDARQLVEANKKAEEQLSELRTEFDSVNAKLTLKQTKCSQLERRLEDVSVQVLQKDKELVETRLKKDKLKDEIEKVRKEHENQVLLLQEDNEVTRNRLQEVEEELNSFNTETDGANNHEMEELKARLEEWKSKTRANEKECAKLRDIQAETLKNFNNEKNKRLRVERNLECSQDEIERMKQYQEQLLVAKQDLRKAEQKFEHERERVGELEEAIRTKDRANQKSQNETSERENKLETKVKNVESKVGDLKQKLSESEQKVVSLTEDLERRSKLEEETAGKTKKLELKAKTTEVELKEIKQKLYESEQRVLSLAEELERRLKVEEEALVWVDGVEKNLMETQKNLIASKQSILLKSEQLDKEKASIMDAVKLLSGYVKSLENSLKEEKTKVNALQEQVGKAKDSALEKCNACVEKDSANSCLTQELEQARRMHREQLEKLKESTTTEMQTLKCQSEEIRLKLTSKVILLQSDISELNTRHQEELDRGNQLHKQELDTLRPKFEECQSSSDETLRLRERIIQLEAELVKERKEHEQKIDFLKSDYETQKTDGRQESGVLSAGLLEDIQEKHSKEIEKLKENHQKELEENKSDMMMVLQALKSNSYQSNTMSNDSHEINDELKKLERYVETLKKDHEKEIDQLKEDHEQDLQQLRSDMVTLLRVQETYKSPAVDEIEGGSSRDVADLQHQLETIGNSYQKQLREKDEKHQEELEQLKSDMLVAIQAASAVGSITPQGITSPRTAEPGNDKIVLELEEKIATMEREFEKERDLLQNAVKKAESATKFGLRRNEEMSNKIYQMQREMEEIDTKYQKEIKLYKQAFDQEKTRKTTIGAVPGILAENESLKVKLQELELTMEQMQVRYDAEIKRYKEKFQQENVLTVEELQLKIKSLEDSIEQMRLEHQNELERYTKAVKRGKVSLAGTVKERDLERKIDDLESKIEVMRQKHREEVRKYRERLEDEMERHRKEVSESRAKLRRLESDTRQMEDLKNKITELENKSSKLNKEANKCKEQEVELTEIKAKNRELQRQVDSLKRKVEKLEESSEDNKKETSTVETGTRTKLSRFSSSDNISLNSVTKTKTQTGTATGEISTSEEDVFELNNNTSTAKAEIGGYKLNPGLTRPASVSYFPIQSENGVRRTSYNDKRRENGSTSGRPYQSPFHKASSVSSLK